MKARLNALVFTILASSLCSAQTFDSNKQLATGRIADAAYRIGDIDARGEFEARTEITFWGEDVIELEMPNVKGQAATAGKTVVLPWPGKGSMEWVEDGNVLRWKMKFPVRPLTNTFTYQFKGNWKDFRYCPQPPLKGARTEFLDGLEHLHLTIPGPDGGDFWQPRQAAGSIVAIHKTKRDHIVGQKNYGSGIAFTILVSKIYDSSPVPKYAWCTMQFDPATGILTEVIPQDFLNRTDLVMPLTANATFGLTDETGGTWGAWNSSQCRTTGPWTCGENGTVTTVHFYMKCGVSADTFKFGLYADNGGTPDGASPVANSITDEGSFSGSEAGQWVALGYSGTAPTVSAQDYWIAINHGTYLGLYTYYIADAAFDYYYDLSTYSSAPIPDPYAATYLADQKLVSYVTYTPSGGPAATGAQVIIVNE